MDGLLLIDKPSGWTSFDVVAKVRGVTGPVFKADGRRPKVGHTGTLDPKATGLLVMTLGTYCKRAAEWSKLDKTYEAEVTLGATSETDDIEGDLTLVEVNQHPDQAAIARAISTFIGSQEQIPPQYSAIKVGGKRAYSQARQGKTVDLKPRPVIIHQLELTNYEWPKLKLKVDVGSGTYIRSLARDLGQELRVGGYLSALRRTSIGPFLVSDALSMSELNTKSIQDHLLQA